MGKWNLTEGSRSRNPSPMALAPSQNITHTAILRIAVPIVLSNMSEPLIGVVNTVESGQPRVETFTPAGAVVEAVQETGHIIVRTGQFLKRFVKDETPWCHIDIAGVALPATEQALVGSKCASGWGVMALNRLVRDMLEG